MLTTTKLLQLAKEHAPYIYEVHIGKKIREITAKLYDLDMELNSKDTNEQRKQQIINAKEILNEKLLSYQAGQKNKGMDSSQKEAQANIL